MITGAVLQLNVPADANGDISPTRQIVGRRGSRRCGYLELFAQRTFAEETERITGGATGRQDPPEISPRTEG